MLDSEIKKRVFVVIPAYNEETTIRKVLEDLKRFVTVENIIVIDDGSTDATFEIAKKYNVQVYRHMINRGVGGALGTGVEAAIIKGAEIIVTLDADAQHDPSEMGKLVDPILKNEADVVIGSRLINRSGEMPLVREIYNWLGNLGTWFLFGIWVSDSQSGFRAFSREAAKKIQIRTNRMEVSSEIIKEIKGNHLRLTEVPIRAIYTNYSMSKGQNFLEGIKTVIKLILLRFRK